MALWARIAMGAKHGRCVLSPATGCDGCGAKAASARSTSGSLKSRHSKPSPACRSQRYRRHDNNHHHIRQYANTVDRHQIEPANPQVRVYVPNYNPATVYGARPNTAYRRCHLPPPPGQQFADSFVKVLVIVTGVATTYALFSSIAGMTTIITTMTTTIMMITIMVVTVINAASVISTSMSIISAGLIGQNLPGKRAGSIIRTAWRPLSE